MNILDKWNYIITSELYFYGYPSSENWFNDSSVGIWIVNVITWQCGKKKGSKSLYTFWRDLLSKSEIQSHSDRIRPGHGCNTAVQYPFLSVSVLIRPLANYAALLQTIIVADHNWNSSSLFTMSKNVRF